MSLQTASNVSTVSKDACISVSGVSKTYRILRREDQPSTAAEAMLKKVKESKRANVVEHFDALHDVSFEVPWGEVVGHHRAQRRRQEHAAQDHHPDHRPHHGPDRARRPGRQPPRGGYRVPPRAHRPGERLPQRHPARHAPQGDQGAVRRHRRLRRHGEVPRHPGQAVLHRHVHPAGLRRRRPPRQRDPGGGRGPGRRGLGLPGQVPAQDPRGGPRRPHRAGGQPPAADGVRPVQLGALPRLGVGWCSTAPSRRPWRSTSAASPAPPR